MMTFILTLLLTFLLVLGALLVFWRFGSPVYRVERHQVITLLELVLAGEATEADWAVFAAYPIRHDPALQAFQNTCLEIAETEYIGGSNKLFTPKGLEQIAGILEKMKTLEEGEKSDV